METPEETDWEGGKGKAALRDERKMMAGRGGDGRYKEKSGGNAEGDAAVTVQGQLGGEEGGDGGERGSDTDREAESLKE